MAETAIQALHDYPLETITPDRGSEFRYHDRVTEGVGGVQFYFSLPHHPWQWGTNENIVTCSKGKALKELRSRLETINKTASELIADIDRHFVEICKTSYKKSSGKREKGERKDVKNQSREKGRS